MALTKEQVLQLRGDLSQFLFHLTRTGIVTIRKDIFPQISGDIKYNRNAKFRLEKILDGKTIKAISPFGFFNYKVRYPGALKNSDSKVQREWLKAVCFTETPLDHVHIQTKKIQGRALEFEPYGLAFREEFVKARNGSPVLYFNSANASVLQSLDDLAISNDASKFKTLMPLFESFGPRLFGSGTVDFRWEREWRTFDDFSFSFSDVAFGLCKAEDIPYFEKKVENAFPFIDPTGDINSVKAKLRKHSQLSNLK